MPTERKQQNTDRQNTDQKGASMGEDARRTSVLQIAGMRIAPRGRFWTVHDRHGQLMCVTVYKKGAREVVRRLSLGRREEGLRKGPGSRPSRKAPAPARRAASSSKKRLPCGWHAAIRASAETD